MMCSALPYHGAILLSGQTHDFPRFHAVNFTSTVYLHWEEESIGRLACPKLLLLCTLKRRMKCGRLGSQVPDTETVRALCLSDI
jgi:hypothetical protein